MGMDLLDICRWVCADAERRGVEAEAYASWNRNISVEIENTEVNLSSTDIDSGMGVRVLRDGRIGSAHTDSLGKRATTLLKRASALAPLGRKVSFGFEPPHEYPSVPGVFDRRVADLDAAELFGMAKEMLEGARAAYPGILVPSGGVAVNVERVALASTRGLEAEGENTLISAWLTTTVEREERTTGFEGVTSRCLDIDPGEVGMLSAQVALGTQGRIDIEGGRMDVVFRPRALAEILANTVLPAFHGERVLSGESYLVGSLGSEVMARGVTIRDDGTLPGGIESSPFDHEGVPSRDTTLVRDGVLKGFIYDLASASTAEVESTGNGLRVDYRTLPSPTPRNTIIEADGIPLDSLLARVDRGILVNDIMGAHTADQVSTEFSVGTTSLFLVEKGCIVGPVSRAVIAGDSRSMLKRFVAAGDDPRPITDETTIYLPTMCFSGMNVICR